MLAIGFGTIGHVEGWALSESSYPSAAPPLEFKGVGFGFGDDPCGLFQDVDLTINPGEVVAIRGDNGSGKSCLMRLAFGLYTPRVGSVKVFGRSVNAHDHLPHVGFVGGLPQCDGDLPLPPDLPVSLFRRVVTAALAESGADTAWSARTAEVLQLDAPEARDKQFGQLSKGWQLRHQLWAALGKPVRLLLLDEPFDGLDEHIKPAAFHLLQETVQRWKSAVLLVTHHFTEVAQTGACRVFDLAGRTLRPRAAGHLQAAVRVDGSDLNDPRVPVTGIELLGLVSQAVLGEWTATLTVSAQRNGLIGGHS
jgi:ABC-type Mn2+/Zn2+ transport system ATPase subunit